MTFPYPTETETMSQFPNHSASPLQPSSPSDIPLGAEVRDTVTDFTGLAIARVEYLTGCTQIGIQPPCADGKNEIPSTTYLDWQRLVVLDYDYALQDLATSAVTAEHNGAGPTPTANTLSPRR